MHTETCERRCPTCCTWKHTDNFYNKKLKSGRMGWQSECKVCFIERCREIRNRPEVVKRERARKQTPKYREREREYKKTEIWKQNRRKYTSSTKGRETIKAARKKWKNNPGVSTMLSLNESLRRMMKKPDYKSHLLDYMKISRDEFISQLNNMISLEPGMNWDNYGYRNAGYEDGWDIDHIIPKSQYDHTDEEDIARCWNIQNLTPKWHKDNLKKTNKILPLECLKVPQELWPKAWNGVIPNCGDSTNYTFTTTETITETSVNTYTDANLHIVSQTIFRTHTTARTPAFATP